MTDQKVPISIRIGRFLIKKWPIRHGKGIVYRFLLNNDSKWPEKASFDMRYGRFINASLKPWPYGFRELFLHGIMDSLETLTWNKLLCEGDAVIDGGANWGYFTLVASKAVGLKGRVFAFEPVVQTFQALCKNIEASNAGNISTVQMALSNKRENITLYLCNNDPFNGKASAGTYKGEMWSREVAICSSITIDDFVTSNNILPAFIKLDIEGSELFALQGAIALLHNDEPPLVCFEWNEATASGLGYHPQKTVEFLTHFGYVPYLIGKEGFMPFSVRKDIQEWSPMIWCFKKGQMRNRAIKAGLLSSLKT